jgi:5-methylcytosine-specific restriction endonuclease McrA
MNVLKKLNNGKTGAKCPIKRTPSGKPAANIEMLNEWLAKQKSYFKRKQDLNKTKDRNIFRFQIFKRDSFRCQYCGRSPKQDENVILHIDHIIPQAKGGADDDRNLTTACQECNLGKSDVLLNEE